MVEFTFHNAPDVPETDFLVGFQNLRACSLALQRPSVKLRSCDFETALEHAKAGDVVYLDPPYVNRHNNNGFVDYNEILCSWEDQKRLAKRACKLAKAGVHVIVTNANHREVLELSRGFKRRTLTRYSTLASDTKSQAL